MKIKEFFVNALHLGHTRLPAEAYHAYVASTIGANMQKSDDETRFKELEACRYDFLHDDKLDEIWENLMYNYKVFPDPANSSGYSVVKVGLNLSMVALRNLMSKLNNTNFLSLDAAELIRIDANELIRRVRMSMHPLVYTQDMAAFLKWCEIEVEYQINNALGGKKARLLLNPTKTFDVGVHPQQQTNQPKEII